MAINFEKTFGASDKNSTAAAGKDDRAKAQLWLNVGYLSNAVDPETGERRFVSLPGGIPLDTMEKLDTRSRNRDYADFQAARNDVLDQCLAAGETLEPGASVVFETESGLAIQIRRVSPVLEAAEAGEGNAYARGLQLAG